jgi:serine/threonine protein kinase/Tol biopolymer transport system component
MTPERYRQVGEIYHAALEVDLEQRAGFLDRACAGDEALRREVESLIASHEQGSGFIAAPALAVAAELLAESQADALIGQTVSRYRIHSLLGVGGMGRVYLAEDTELGRRVALKFLPEYFTHDKNQVQRFRQEARAASALNHPNILTVYEVGQVNGLEFIATEYVEGETLRARLKENPFNLQEALKVATQIADALVAAHEAGIIHRDIKPENVMRRRDGIVKVMDFGLAKLSRTLTKEDAAEKEGATRLMVNTTPGVVMGTVGYMSPEQAQGKAVDLRSDIFSFGCVLFEAVTGHKLFEGDSAIDSLHKTVHAPAPPIGDFNPAAPLELQRIVRRCLMKDPEQRYQTIKDVAIELRELRRELENEGQLPRSAAASSPGGAGVVESGAQTRSAAITHPPQTEDLSAVRPTSSAEYLVSEIKRRKRGLSIALAVLVVVLAGGGYGIYRLKVKPNNPALSFQAAKFTRLTTNGKVKLAAISPDGKYMVHVVDDGGQESLWMRHVATQSNVQIVPPAKAHYYGLTFSPEGNYVYFLRRNEGGGSFVRILYQTPVLGGDTRKVWEDVDSPVTFSPDGKQFAFIRLDGTVGESHLLIANTDGSGERKLATKKQPDGFGIGGPAWSPDGRAIACGVLHPVAGREAEPVELAEVNVTDGTERPITSHRWRFIDQVAWLPDGGRLLLSAGDVSSAFFDQLWDVSRSNGETRRITNDLSFYFGISLTADSNSLLTVQSDMVSNLWVAPGGDANHARQIGSGKYDGVPGVAWTSNNKIVYATLNYDIWIADSDGGYARLLTVDEHNNRMVSVTSDNRYIIFESWRGGGSAGVSGSQIWRTDIDGSNPKRLTNGKGSNSSPTVSPDGKWVVFNSAISGKVTLWKIPIDGGEATQLTDEYSFVPAISPDGKTIACMFRSGYSDPFKLAIIPFEGGQPKKEFDIIPGVNPFYYGRQLRWSPDGRALHIIVNRDGVDNIWSQPIEGGQPVKLTSFKSDRIFAFDWSRDGKQLVLARGNVTPDAVLISNVK